MDRDRLRRSVEKHEGLRLWPYRCSAGKLTIGYGRNLDNHGISTAEAIQLLTHDLNRCEMAARHGFPMFSKLTPLRQEVIVEMIFQLGMAGVMRFKRMIQAIRDDDYTLASVEMLASRWYAQTPGRVLAMAEKMRTE